MRRSPVVLAAIVVAGVLFAGACGGDDDDAADSTRRDDAPEDAARPGSDAATTTTTTTAGGAGDDNAAGPSADSSASVAEIGEMDFCDGFRAAIRLDSTTAIDGARQLEAPEEIAGDWRVFLDFAEASMTDEPTAANPEATGAAAETATANVLAYVGRECGYSVDQFTGEVTESGDG